MFRGRANALICIIAAMASACDDSSDAPRAPIQPATQPWMVRPEGAEEYLAATRAATLPATTAATAPTTQFDPLSRPDTAIEHMFTLIREERFQELRELMVEPSTPSKLRAEFHNSVEGFKRGATVAPIEFKEFRNAALVIVRSTGANPKDQDLGHFMLIKTFDHWKVLPAEPNPKRLGPEEKQNLREVMQWGLERLRALHAEQRQATTGPVRPPREPAIAPAPEIPAAPDILPAPQLPPAPVIPPAPSQ